MPALHSTLSSVLTNHYTKNGTRIHELATPLTNAQFWQKPFPFGNSFGHLVLHLTGNLNYYIGAQIAKTGYVRDRPREFNEPNPPSKDEALKRLDDAVAMVVRTIKNQSPDDWSAAYSAVGTEAHTRLAMITQCEAHAAPHRPDDLSRIQMAANAGRLAIGSRPITLPKSQGLRPTSKGFS
jgi:hypothetical protein